MLMTIGCLQSCVWHRKRLVLNNETSKLACCCLPALFFPAMDFAAALGEPPKTPSRSRSKTPSSKAKAETHFAFDDDLVKPAVKEPEKEKAKEIEQEKEKPKEKVAPKSPKSAPTQVRRLAFAMFTN